MNHGTGFQLRHRWGQRSVASLERIAASGRTGNHFIIQRDWLRRRSLEGHDPRQGESLSSRINAHNSWFDGLSDYCGREYAPPRSSGIRNVSIRVGQRRDGLGNFGHGFRRQTHGFGHGLIVCGRIESVLGRLRGVECFAWSHLCENPGGDVTPTRHNRRKCQDACSLNNAFRGPQQDIVEHVIAWRSPLVLMPHREWRKSLCYPVPAC